MKHQLVNFLNRLTCSHFQYLIIPENPEWARCVCCGKTKRLG